MPPARKPAPRRRAIRRVVGMRYKRLGLGKLRRIYNPAPVFTETYSYLTSGHDYIVAPNAGNLLKVNMDQIPQLAQYTNLYQKYRIIKAVFILMPKFHVADQNAGQYNVSNTTYAYGDTRVVYAVNDTPGQVAPAAEGEVLQDNGCVIKSVGAKGIRIGCRPVANLKDANGVQLTQKGKYINFQASGSNIDHFGVSIWMSQPTSATGASALLNSLYGYVKLTFQLSDPK